MKKKDEIKNIQFLERKYQQEKQILVKQNAKLQLQLNQEIENGNILRLKIQKLQQNLQFKEQEMQRQNQQLRAKVLFYEQEQKQISQIEEEEIEHLKYNKLTINENLHLRKEIDSMSETIQIIDAQNRKLEEQINYLRKNEEQFKIQIQNLNQLHQKFKKQSLQQIRDKEEKYRKAEDESIRAVNKLNQYKKKKRDLESKIEELENLVVQVTTSQQKNYEEQIEILRSQKEKIYQQKIEITTKIELMQINLNQKDDYIHKMEGNLVEQQRLDKQQLNTIQELNNKLQKTQNENRKILLQLEQLRQKSKHQIQQQKKNIEDSINQMRRNMIQQMFVLFKDKDQERIQKNLNKYIDELGLKNCKSQTLLNQASFKRLNSNSSSNNDLLDRVKLESQINTMENQLSKCKKQNDLLNLELIKMKKIQDEKENQNQKNQKEIHQLKRKLQKAQVQKSRELVQLKNQNINLKNKQTERLEILRDRNQYEEAVSLKLSFYERKIKQHLETIERKDSIIDKLKQVRFENDQKIKNLQQNIKKMAQQLETGRRMKQQLIRKDDLVKQYKLKIQKMKKQLQQLRFQFENIRKDKIRLEKLIDSKESYIISLKSKHQKDKSQIENVKPVNQDTKVRQLKSSYENKLKKAKKQQQEYFIILCQIKQALISKVNQNIARSIPVTKKKTQEYEAAKLLGLKSAELQQFLNPQGNDRSVSVELEHLWQQGNYIQFVELFIKYLDNKN